MNTACRIVGWVLVAAGITISPPTAEARAVHVTASSPVADEIIRGDHAEYVVRFDGPINHFASRLEITQDGHLVRTLTPRADSAVDVLFAAGPVPAAGRYGLRWTAVSADGETTSGDVPFTVGH